MDKLWYLKRCDLFRDLDKSAIDKVAAIAHERTVPKKKIIFMPEDESGVMFIAAIFSGIFYFILQQIGI